MRRAHQSEEAVLCLATFFCAGESLSLRHAMASETGRPIGAPPTGLIRDRREIPPDPLGGLPEDEPDRKPRGRDKGKGGQGQGARGQGHADDMPTCRLEAKPESDREVADLRAAVAVIQRGPRTASCPAGHTADPLRLRLTLDGAGKITAVERLSGDEKLGDLLGRKLVGQISLSKVTSATSGVTQIHLRRVVR